VADQPSIPLDTRRRCLKDLARRCKYLFSTPDGEVGPRRHWISRVHYQVLAARPELDVGKRPARMG
jgi:hypothetical protein